MSDSRRLFDIREDGIILSIKDVHWRRIQAGTKTVEVRKTIPFMWDIFRTKHGHMRCYCYVSGTGLVHGYIDVDRIVKTNNPQSLAVRAMLTDADLKQYGTNPHGFLYGLFICREHTFEKPVPLELLGIKKAPQSWCYYKAAKSQTVGNLDN